MRLIYFGIDKVGYSCPARNSSIKSTFLDWLKIVGICLQGRQKYRNLYAIYCPWYFDHKYKKITLFLKHTL